MSAHQRQPLELDALRARLAAKRGPDYWRSLEELAQTPEFEEYLHREFPENASEWNDPIGRRRFLQLMAASLALAGLSTACTRQPTESIVPYVRQPEQFIPGRPLYYATAMTLSGYATGLLVESHLGRPTKIEGNELHPASLGATDAFAQASILSLYDPDRSQVVLEAGRISTWSAFLAALNRALANQAAKRGAGLRLLTETVTSPTLARQIQALLAKYPEARWHQYEPVNRDNAREGARLAFGQVVETQYRFDKAGVVLSLDADFLGSGPGSVRYARDFMQRRRAGLAGGEMNRLYVVESTPSLTGALADHRLPLPSGRVALLTDYLATKLASSVGSHADFSALTVEQKLWADALAEDLKKHTAKSIVVAGDGQHPWVHDQVHYINWHLGNLENTVFYTDPLDTYRFTASGSMRELAEDMLAGKVELLVILGGNPVYNAPADVGFAAKLEKVPFRAHLSLYEDETSYLCHWHIPEAHYLEAWGDARAYDGTVTIQQPLIAPLYGGKSAYELLAALNGQPGASAYDIIRDYWKSKSGAKDFESFWRRAVHDGLIQGTSFPTKKVTLNRGANLAAAENQSAREGIEVVFRADPTVYDGRFANNGWLQELPKPLTKLTWDNPCLLSPATAQRLGVTNEDVVEIRHEGRRVRAPVWISPGHADDSVTVFLGYGRTRAGRIGTGIGYNAYAIRTATAPWFATGVEIVQTGERHPLACTQNHHSMEGRALVRAGTIEEYQKHPDFVQEMGEEPPRSLSLYPEHKYDGYAWGMAIDLNACTGCGACVVACQAENNIPIVGKEQVARGREMHWLRVDRYFKGALDAPETYHQPVPCMHCENAPCEVVCPVAATVHSDEGLNDMVYNRCVGTRYCSNNCPYKVRRFNFLKYNDDTTPVLKLLRNPDVTVRMRGVMEKCTYCVQRIQEAKIGAEKQDRAARDGEIQTACQQVCPTQAIVFGNLNDPKSRVSELRAEKRHYALLANLNTRPRTTYLARLRNPNPELEKK
ncbi:MAG TPA: TAT-variant-translocated molybdopterin oxidoreductase [Candidatus Xenobia bacterium]|nr:TAT-variant-translocated molybdopterin oxidoreductase [Candidatus Xenobia bacterium]